MEVIADAPLELVYGLCYWVFKSTHWKCM